MVDSGFLVNSVLNMLLVVRLPSLVTESEIRVPSLLVGGDLAAGPRRVPLYAPRPGWGEGVTFAARGREVALWGLTCRYFRGLWTEKSKLYARILVSQGPSGTYGVGWMRRRGRVPDGLPDRSPDAARNATGATFAGH